MDDRQSFDLRSVLQLPLGVYRGGNPAVQASDVPSSQRTCIRICRVLEMLDHAPRPAPARGISLTMHPAGVLFRDMSSALSATLPPLSGATTMAELLRLYPGAQRALFARYHIGGCRSCGFQPAETLEQVCGRNENIPVEEAIEHIQQSHEADASLQISPAALAELRETSAPVRLLDARSREEHEAVAIPGSRLLTQDLVQEIFNSWSKSDPLVIYDHHGDRSLDAAAYFIGHGFSETKCLAGGIDAWSVEVDPSLPRYKVEFE